MSEALLKALLHQALLLAVAVAMLAVIRPLLRRLGAGAAYAAWLLMPALLLTPALPRPTQEPLRVVLAAAGNPADQGVPTVPAPPADTAPLWLALWLAGTVLVLAVQARRQWRLSRLGTCLPAGSSPALVGLLRPRIALPVDFEQRFPPAERALILAHEQVHRDRLDNLWNLLACLLTALHWWNPLAWLAARRMQADQELACDAVVLQRKPDALATYTHALLAAHDLTPHGAPLASRWGSSHPLVERIAMLTRPTLFSRRRAAMVSLALLAVVGVAYAAQGNAPPAANGASKVEIRMTLASGEDKVAPRLITTLGVPARIEWGAKPGEVWRMDMVVTRDDRGMLKVDTDTSYRSEKLGLHTSHIASGGTQGLSLGQAGGPTLEVSRIVTLIPADQ